MDLGNAILSHVDVEVAETGIGRGEIGDSEVVTWTLESDVGTQGKVSVGDEEGTALLAALVLEQLHAANAPRAPFGASIYLSLSAQPRV